MIIIASAILPSPRSTIFEACPKFTNMEPRYTIRKYCTPIACISPSAPIRVRSCGAKIYPTIITTEDISTDNTKTFPITASMVFWSFLPTARDKIDAEPIPTNTAIPLFTSVKAYATLIAPSAFSPTYRPTNIASTKLYKLITSIPMIPGTPNCNMSLNIFPETSSSRLSVIKNS